MNRPWLNLLRPTLVTGGAAVTQGLGGVAALWWTLYHADAIKAGGPEVAFLFLLIGFVGCGLMLLPTHMLALLAGWALGPVTGTSIAWLAATAAAPLGYAWGGLLAGSGLTQWAQRYPRPSAFCHAIAQAPAVRATLLMTLLRLSPVIPYGSTNVLAAAFRLRMPPFVLGTALGLLPRIAAVALVGSGLSNLQSQSTTDLSNWVWLLGLLATVAVVTLLVWIGRESLRLGERLLQTSG